VVGEEETPLPERQKRPLAGGWVVISPRDIGVTREHADREKSDFEILSAA
jgi:hypothetical protein